MHLLTTYGYWAVLVFVAIESTGIPFPGETMLLVAAIYAGIAAAPGLPPGAPTGFDETQLRLTSLVIAVVALAFFALQLVAVVGLARGRSWAQMPATLACVVWALTCIGLPLALLGLNALWRGPGPDLRGPAER